MMQGQNFSDSNHPDIVFILSSRQMFGRYGVGLRPEIWREFVTRFFLISFNFAQLSLSSRFPLILSLLLSSCLISFLPNFSYFLQLSIVCFLTGSTFQPFESSTAPPREPTAPSTSETKRWVSDGREVRITKREVRITKNKKHQKQRGGSAMEER